jgi:hypothetical protein
VRCLFAVIVSALLFGESLQAQTKSSQAPQPRNQNSAQVASQAEPSAAQKYLISITVDPVTDTPARLKEYAAKFHARPGWYFMTGTQENVNFDKQSRILLLGPRAPSPACYGSIDLLGAHQLRKDAGLGAPLRAGRPRSQY